MKKGLMIIGGIVVGIVVLVVAVLLITSLTSKKLVCKSAEGNITLMYNDKTIKGYVASGVSYDLDEQKALAEKIGVEEYMTQFIYWFESNSTGSCEKK